MLIFCFVCLYIFIHTNIVQKTFSDLQIDRNILRIGLKLKEAIYGLVYDSCFYDQSFHQHFNYMQYELFWKGGDSRSQKYEMEKVSGTVDLLFL